MNFLREPAAVENQAGMEAADSLKRDWGWVKVAAAKVREKPDSGDQWTGQQHEATAPDAGPQDAPP